MQKSCMRCIKHYRLPRAISKCRKMNAKNIITKTRTPNTLRCSEAYSRWKGWPRQVSYTIISFLNFIFHLCRWGWDPRKVSSYAAQWKGRIWRCSLWEALEESRTCDGSCSWLGTAKTLGAAITFKPQLDDPKLFVLSSVLHRSFGHCAYIYRRN